MFPLKRLFLYPLLPAFFLLSFTGAKGQAFYLGTHVASLGAGFMGSWPFATTSNSPAVGLHYEHGIYEMSSGSAMGVGFYVGEKSLVWHKELGDALWEESKWKYTFAGITGSYHYNAQSRLDPYLNVMLGMKMLKYTFIYSDPNHAPPGGPPSADYPKTSFAYQLSVGARYFFSNNIAAFLDAGYGFSYITGGVTVKVF